MNLIPLEIFVDAGFFPKKAAWSQVWTGQKPQG